MKYWSTYSSIMARIVRVSAEMTNALRVFCYTFVVGGLLKPTQPIKIGLYDLGPQFIEEISKIVFIFIILDILQPLVYLITLQIINLIRWKKYKVYTGSVNKNYDEKKR